MRQSWKFFDWDKKNPIKQKKSAIVIVTLYISKESMHDTNRFVLKEIVSTFVNLKLVISTKKMYIWQVYHNVGLL